jgi:hypothetical protein
MDGRLREEVLSQSLDDENEEKVLKSGDSLTGV